MLNAGAVRTSRIVSDIGHHLKGPAFVASRGLEAAHQLREVAPMVLGSLTRALPHPSASARLVSPMPLPLVTLNHWDEAHWFVTDARRTMVGEIEFVGSGYRVSHTADAKGAVFEFDSLCSATLYFDEYVAALSL